MSPQQPASTQHPSYSHPILLKTTPQRGTAGTINVLAALGCNPPDPVAVGHGHTPREPAHPMPRHQAGCRNRAMTNWRINDADQERRACNWSAERHHGVRLQGRHAALRRAVAWRVRIRSRGGGTLRRTIDNYNHTSQVSSHVRAVRSWSGPDYWPTGSRSRDNRSCSQILCRTSVGRRGRGVSWRGTAAAAHTAR